VLHSGRTVMGTVLWNLRHALCCCFGGGGGGDGGQWSKLDQTIDTSCAEDDSTVGALSTPIPYWMGRCMLADLLTVEKWVKTRDRCVPPPPFPDISPLSTAPANARPSRPLSDENPGFDFSIYTRDSTWGLMGYSRDRFEPGSIVMVSKSEPIYAVRSSCGLDLTRRELSLEETRAPGDTRELAQRVWKEHAIGSQCPTLFARVWGWAYPDRSKTSVDIYYDPEPSGLVPLGIGAESWMSCKQDGPFVLMSAISGAILDLLNADIVVASWAETDVWITDRHVTESSDHRCRVWFISTANMRILGDLKDGGETTWGPRQAAVTLHNISVSMFDTEKSPDLEMSLQSMTGENARGLIEGYRDRIGLRASAIRRAADKRAETNKLD
jgi:hypothetical protein